MKVVVEMDERDYNTMKKGFLIVCVRDGKPLDSVLDEMETEIVKSGDAIVGEGEYFTGVHLGMICALKIIDKYKAESEDNACKDCHYNDGDVHAECVVCDKAESEDKK